MMVLFDGDGYGFQVGSTPRAKPTPTINTRTTTTSMARIQLWLFTGGFWGMGDFQQDKMCIAGDDAIIYTTLHSQSWFILTATKERTALWGNQ